MVRGLMVPEHPQPPPEVNHGFPAERPKQNKNKMPNLLIDKEVNDKNDAEEYLKLVASQIALGLVSGAGWSYHDENEDE